MPPISKNSKIIVMNIGTGKFFLHQTAETLNELGLLIGCITGLVRLPKLFRFFRINSHAKIQRLLNRMMPLDQEVKQIQVLSGEFYWQCATYLARFQIFRSPSKFFYFYSARRFDIAAQKFLKKNIDLSNCIYHFRAGFGGDSVKLAKNIGMITICDHSISHPNYNWWTKKRLEKIDHGRFNLEQLILNDINEADHVIVNSAFVAETFQICGDNRQLHVMKQPTDRIFLLGLEKEIASVRVGVTFVGKCEFRKGIDILTEIVMHLPSNFPVRIVGTWTPQTSHYLAQLKEKSNVKILPYQSAAEISKLLKETLIFLFPSRAEGSARVISEAMHSGCIPLITRESGVILKPESGYILNERSPEEIANLIVEISSDKEKQLAMSAAAIEAIKSLEKSYIPELIYLYSSIMNEN